MFSSIRWCAMKIVADENIPFAREFFGLLGEVVTVPGRKIPPEILRDAGALIIRSVTRVDQALLDHAPDLKFVGTCTIGTDHVDQELLSSRGIAFCSAPGCNRLSVGQYVLSSLVRLSRDGGFPLRGMTLGIIGGGNTGTACEDYARILGLIPRVYDPFLEETGRPEGRDYVSYEEALASDIVTFHVPLTRDGSYPTFHMLGAEELASLPSGRILVNASRGAVWDNQALLRAMGQGAGFRLIMDVWEGEPEVLAPLIPLTMISTPHIAGYSTEGKLRGTSMVARSLAEHLGRSVTFPSEEELLGILSLPETVCTGDDISLGDLILATYDPLRDSRIFRQEYRGGESFDLMRKNYPGRREWSSFRISARDETAAGTARHLGFRAEI